MSCPLMFIIDYFMFIQTRVMWSEDTLHEVEGYVWDYQPTGTRKYINESNEITYPIS